MVYFCPSHLPRFTSYLTLKFLHPSYLSYSVCAVHILLGMGQFTEMWFIYQESYLKENELLLLEELAVDHCTIAREGGSGTQSCSTCADRLGAIQENSCCELMSTAFLSCPGPWSLLVQPDFHLTEYFFPSTIHLCLSSLQ